MVSNSVINTPFRASAGACATFPGRGDVLILGPIFGADQGTSVSTVGPDLKARRVGGEQVESVFNLARMPKTAPTVLDAFSGVPSWSPPV